MIRHLMPLFLVALTPARTIVMASAEAENHAAAGDDDADEDAEESAGSNTGTPVDETSGGEDDSPGLGTTGSTGTTADETEHSSSGGDEGSTGEPAPAEVGEPCEADSACESGLCVWGVCAIHCELDNFECDASPAMGGRCVPAGPGLAVGLGACVATGDDGDAAQTGPFDVPCPTVNGATRATPAALSQERFDASH